MSEMETTDHKQELESALVKLRYYVYNYILANYGDADIPQLPPQADPSPLVPPPRFQQLALDFSLSQLEQDILLLCLGSELDPILPVFYNHVVGGSYPTITLAQNLYPQSTGTVTPESPLRFWRLIILKDPLSYLHTPVTVPERVIQYLLGSDTMEEELVHMVRQIDTGSPIPEMNLFFDSIAQSWINPLEQQHPIPIQFQHWDNDECRQAAVFVAVEFEKQLLGLRLQDLPDPERLPYFFNILGRELILEDAYLFIDCSAIDKETPHSTRYHRMQSFIKKMSLWFYNRVMFSAAVPLLQHDCDVQTAVLPDRTVTEQCAVWQRDLDMQERITIDELKRVSEQFRLSLNQTRIIAQQWNMQIAADAVSPAGFDLLWNLCRWNLKRIVPPQLNIIKAKAGLADLVLPSRSQYLLTQFIAQARNRCCVYEDWGFSLKSDRGLGQVALFSGYPGTGKTTAAEVMANELNLDLVQVNLSQTVSKYIGETEKNLEDVFNFADRSGAILLFDEADSIFSKRSAVTDSRDHYANQQVSYLLQKIETYRGVTILTTNFMSNIDSAFLRRIRFVIPFQLPGVEERRMIWQTVFPPLVPLGVLDYTELARYNLSGGEIKSAAINAAFLAAYKNCPVDMVLLEEAIQEEYKKNEKPISKE